MSLFGHLKDEIVRNATIPQEAYAKYDVKRGLRNKDGSGVLAGLTRISTVIGSQIIDGDRLSVDGQLKYRDIEIQELMSLLGSVETHLFERVVFLLLVGRLPSPEELAELSAFMAQERHLPDFVLEHVIKGVPSRDVMNKLQTSVCALYAADDMNPDSIDPYENFIQSVKLISKIPAIVAYSYLAAFETNPVFVTPNTRDSHAASFLTMLRQGATPDPFEAKMLDLCLVLHAEHGGGNNSTFTTYVVTSTASDLYSVITAAIGSLKGPLHGSANKKVMDMMEDIKANVKNWKDETEVGDYLLKILKKETHDRSGKIYGLGHAVYTKSDPRAIVLKQYADKLAKDKNRLEEYELYLLIEKIGPGIFNTFKGISKPIAPNVDFFSGFVYDCLSLPAAIYTPLFAMGRVSGWCAHRIEENLSSKRIIRPAYKWIG